MGFAPSTFQKDIFVAVRDTNDSLSVQAVAGSGKTTTIVAAAKLIPVSKKVIFVAFNKAIAEELGSRLPEHVDASTMHSLGFRSWKRYAGQVKIDQKKTYTILDGDEWIANNRLPELKHKNFVLKTLIGLAKNAGIVPASFGDKAKGLVEDTDDVWFDMIDHFNIEFGIKNDGYSRREYAELVTKVTLNAIEICRRVLHKSLQAHKLCDFDDMLYLPVVFGTAFPRYDVVMVDEAQDISTIQRVMLKKTMKKTGRIIAVGDTHQAIYGFRGADSESMNLFKTDFNMRELPLSICYRCPKSVVEEAKKLVPHIEAREDAPEGTVAALGSYVPGKMEEFQPHDYVICRNVAPLVKCAFNLIAVNKACNIIGKDIGKQIITLIEKLKAQNLVELRGKVNDWETNEIDRMTRQNPEANVGGVKDRADALRNFIELSGANTIKELVKRVDELFSENAEGVIRLSTIHKAKGLEAERVLILDKHLMPSKYAKNEWMLQQEDNLLYVAITRALDYLGYVYTPKDDDEKEDRF